MQNKMSAKRIVDVCMTILLICLMAYQVTGEQAHEWIGVTMTIVVLVHQFLNRRWYGALLKGKYNTYRIFLTVVNVLLILSIALTAFCGMSMSTYAVPFLYGIAKLTFVRITHLSMSHWAFVFMGMHLGMHVPMMAPKLIPNKGIAIASFCCACLGFFLFLQNGMQNYLFFKVAFAFLDYEKASVMVFLENVLMLWFWVYVGIQIAMFAQSVQMKQIEKRKPVLHVAYVIVSVIPGILLNLIYPPQNIPDFENADWDTSAEPAENTVQPTETQDIQNTAEIQDGFLLIDGGTFLMGSPETENWRIEDETLHEVNISSFYVDAYETLQTEYERLMGNNPSTFTGENLPVENISWLEAVAYANAKSEETGLTPVYTITEDGVAWDTGADGYRLPTEAEWEYFCRAGTTTPFNTEKSLDATEANFYGHYPYEIEENYFNNSVLEAKPGEYRQTTTAVGSFQPNAWGLYDCHGNVNEWCWDYYGEYDPEQINDPTGSLNGTRHVYRGGGWNDFAKNMRSAYRAAGQADMRSYNLGVRLVRNANQRQSQILTAKEEVPVIKTNGKTLIAYFSWGGNTRGIAQEIQRQTDADIIEITLVHPYSTDYNTVLMEAQKDQHVQARPELAIHVENMADYDTILLGYPNWWASIPMPIASFLEEYDFSGKRIIPFCSHGGGRFGQSLSAIAKLAPDANIGEGLSVHYSGGASLSDDVSAWLETNEIER